MREPTTLHELVALDLATNRAWAVANASASLRACSSATSWAISPLTCDSNCSCWLLAASTSAFAFVI